MSYYNDHTKVYELTRRSLMSRRLDEYLATLNRMRCIVLLDGPTGRATVTAPDAGTMERADAKCMEWGWTQTEATKPVLVAPQSI